MDSSQSIEKVISYDDEIVKKTKHNFKTKIGKEYSAEDVIKVWDCISKWIANNMDLDKGVVIRGIGYFTVAKWELNVGKGYPYIISNPVFVIDEKLAKDYNLKRKRAYNTGNIREHTLNLLSVARDYKLNVNMVNHCFKEVVVAFRKLLYEERNCELPFSKIGKLQIKNKMVSMKFYREFLDRQNQNVMVRIEDEKIKLQMDNYDPNTDLDKYNRKRPCSSMSIISRPSSSLSQYRPGTGYEGVLPCTTFNNRPESRPDSRASSRPNSRLSLRSDQQVRPQSRLSTYSTRSSESLQSRPVSRLSGDRSRPCSRHSEKSDRPQSRSSTKSNRSQSRSSVHTLEGCVRPMPRSTALPTDYDKHKPNKPGSRISNHSIEEVSPSSMHACSTISSKSPSVVVDPEKISSSELKSLNEDKKCVNENTLFMMGTYDNENMCCSCKIRKYNLDQSDRLNLSSTDNKDSFMKGDNPFNGLDSNTTSKERKNRVKETSDYNYVTAKKLLDAINDEKNNERNVKTLKNYIFHKRPASTLNSFEKKITFKHSLLDQMERNKIKRETDKRTSINSEKVMQNELLKSLHSERIKNIEAKKRSKENYLILIAEHRKKKREIAEENEKYEELTMSKHKNIFGTCGDQFQPNKLANNREVADFQLKQLMERNLENEEQKKKDSDFGKCLLNQIKIEDQMLQKKMLQKKLNRKKFLAEDLNKLLTVPANERHKNDIPGAYPMNFPLKKLGQRCRVCKSNALGIPVEKISDLS